MTYPKRHFSFLFLSLILLHGCGLTGEVREAQEEIVLEDPIPRILLTKFGGDEQAAGIGDLLSEDLMVKVQDENGEPLAYQRVVFSASDGSVQFETEADVLTDEEGLAAVQIRLGATPGDLEVVAEVLPNPDEQENQQVRFSILAKPVDEPRLFMVAGDGQVGVVEDTIDPLVILAKDRFGEPVANATIQLTLEEGVPVVMPETLTTNLEGIASADITLGTTWGTSSIRATWDGDARGLLFRLTANPGDAATLSFETTQSLCAGENQRYSDITMRLQDRNGNPSVQKNIVVTPENASVGSAAQNTEVVLTTDGEGRIRFSTKAGTVAGTTYSGTARIRAHYAGASSVAPEPKTLEVTKNLYITQRISSLRTYADSLADSLTIKVKTKGACGGSAAGKTIKYYEKTKDKACYMSSSSFISDWEYHGESIVDSNNYAEYTKSFFQYLSGIYWRYENRDGSEKFGSVLLEARATGSPSYSGFGYINCD